MSAKLVAIFLLLVVVSHASDISDAKSRILNVLLKFRTRSKLSEEDLHILKTADEDDLPIPVKRVVKVISSGANVCCRNVPTTVITRSRASRRVTTVKTNYKAGYSHCGLWGWKRCARYDNRYSEVVSYKTEYYKTSLEGTCPEKDVVCCHMFVNVSGRCVRDICNFMKSTPEAPDSDIHDLSSASNQLVG